MEKLSKEDLNNMEKAELVSCYLQLQEKIDNLSYDGVTQMYIALNDQFLDWAEQLKHIKVKISDDNTSVLFDKLVRLAKESGTITQNMEMLGDRANKQALVEHKKKKAKEGSLEDRIAKRK